MTLPPMPDLGDRTQYLGASDVASLLGLDEYRTPRDLWAEKTGQSPPKEDTEDIVRGHLMEPVIAELLKRDGLTLFPGGEWPVPGTPLRVHPDRLDDKWQVHEIKAPRRFSAQWGAPNTDEVPQRYLVQVQVQAFAVHSSDFGYRDGEPIYLHAMAGERRRYVIGYSSDVARRIVDHASAWWTNYVMRGVEPPAASMVELNKITRRRAQVVVSADVVADVARLALLRKVETRAKDMADEIKRQILANLGADGSLPESIGGPDGEVVATIKRGKRRRLDTELVQQLYPEAVDACTVTDEWNELRPARVLAAQQQLPEILAKGDANDG